MYTSWEGGAKTMKMEEYYVSQSRMYKIEERDERNHADAVTQSINQSQRRLDGEIRYDTNILHCDMHTHSTNTHDGGRSGTHAYGVYTL